MADLGEWWSSRLVATAEEDRLSYNRWHGAVLVMLAM
jgi:hypothetical protein